MLRQNKIFLSFKGLVKAPFMKIRWREARQCDVPAAGCQNLSATRLLLLTAFTEATLGSRVSPQLHPLKSVFHKRGGVTSNV